MRKQLLALATIMLCIACGKKTKETEKFDTAKWAITDNSGYPYRDAMLGDLMTNYELHGVPKDSILALLGTPTKTDYGYFFYRVEENKLGVMILHTKTLVLKLTADSTVEWLKIHE